MTRILVIVVCIGLLIYLATKLLGMINFNACKSCKGEGYWLGTRGERNDCRTCGGSGKR